MAETLFVRSVVMKFLARQQLTVADLLRRMDDSGFRFDKKTIYRLTTDSPVRSLNLPAMAAIGRVLKLSDPGKLIDWSAASGEPQRLQRLDAVTQTRLDELMSKNTEGALSAAERREFYKLGRLVEKLSLENARLLAVHGAAAGAGDDRKRSSTPRRPPRRRSIPGKRVRKAAVA